MATDRDANRNRLLAVITVLLLIAGLRASYPVTMPLAAATIVVAAVWPIRAWLNQILPSTISYIGTVLALVLIFISFIAAIYFSTAQMVQVFTQNQEQFDRIYASLAEMANRWGLPDPGGRMAYTRLVSFGQTLLERTYTVLVYVGLIAIFVIFGLTEVPSLRSKIQEEFDAPDRRELITAIDEIAGKVRSYLGVTTLTSVMTGLASAIWAFVVGLEFALVWGMLNFLLNYIPVIGNILGIIPPTLYALIQFQSTLMPIIVFFGFAAIQIVISNFIYPTLQGRSLSLSPLWILIALAFWAWIWGVAGALIAIPLTAALVIVCEHFQSTKWIARLLSSSR